MRVADAIDAGVLRRADLACGAVAIVDAIDASVHRIADTRHAVEVVDAVTANARARSCSF